MNSIRFVGTGLVAALTALMTSGAIAPVHAYDAGTLVRCAELTDFVPPDEAQDGSIRLLGIGPGFPPLVDEPEKFPYPFAPDIALEPPVIAQLADLADGDHYTCLRMTAIIDETDYALKLTSIAVAPTTQVCGPISRRFDGVYHFLVVTDWWSDLIGDADALIKSSPYLDSLLGTLSEYQDDSSCLTLATDGSGRLRSVAVDAKIAHCALVRYDDDLILGDLLVGDSDSTSADLLPAKARAAVRLLVDTGIRACLQALVVGGEWQSADLSLSMRRCGDITRSASGAVQIDELAIPAILLTERQAAKLDAAVEGQGCIAVEVVSNVTTVALSDLVGPEPTATPPPTEPPLPSAEPSTIASPALVIPTAPPAPQSTWLATSSVLPTSSPLPAVATVALSGSDPLLPLAVAAMLLLVAGAVGSYLMHRRRRRALEAPTGPGLDEAEALPVDRGAVGLEDAATMAVAADGPAPSQQIALTQREHEVLGMLLEGMSNKEIAGRLFISESTAGVHVSNLMAKLGAHSRGEAATIAYRMGLGAAGRIQH